MHIVRFTPTVPNAAQEYISNRKSAHIIIIMQRYNENECYIPSGIQIQGSP